MSRHVTLMTIDDAEHYSPEERAAIIAAYPAHEREARARGIPVLGSGRIFPVAEEDISIPAIKMPKFWPRIGGLDFGAMKELDIEGEPFPDTDGRCTVFTRKDKTRILVTVRPGAEKAHSPVEIAGILVHEAAHVWQEIRAAMGEKNPSIEFEAYSMQAIFQELYSAFRATRHKL